MKFTGIYFFCYIFWKEILVIDSRISLEKPATTINFDGLINYLKNESKLHQVVFILEDQFDNNADLMMNTLMKAVDEHFPSMTLSYNQISDWILRFYRRNIKRGYHFRRTTLFVFQAENKNFTEQILENLDVINYQTMLALPRCLIMDSFNSTREDLNSTLYSFWQKSYLDTTIMTYDREQQVAPFLSQINPFTRTYTAREVSSEIQWFPNKIRDLHGHEMKFYFNCIFELNDLKSCYKKREKMIEMFSKAMNFKHTDEFLDTCKYHTMGFVPGKFVEDDEQPELYFSTLRILKIDTLRAIIPKTEMLTKDVIFSPELFNMILGTIALIVIIRFTTFYMKFKRSTWQTLNISQVIIGMPANDEPNLLSERMIFGSLLITCMVYTGYFYSVILDINLRSEREISTLEELADSSLINKMDPAVFFSLHESSIPHLKKLCDRGDYFMYNKSTEFHGMYCLEYLVKHKNISCIIIDAEDQINTYSAVNNEDLNVKILPEAVDYYILKVHVNGNSPYSDRYDEIILRATEFGLLKEYYPSTAVLSQKTLSPEEITKEKLFLIIYFLLGIGYSLSLIVFLIEVFAAKFLIFICGRLHINGPFCPR